MMEDGHRPGTSGVGPSLLQQRRHTSNLVQQLQQSSSLPQTQSLSLSTSSRSSLPQLSTTSQQSPDHSPQQTRRSSHSFQYVQANNNNTAKSGLNLISPVVSGSASSNLANAMTHTMISKSNSGTNFSPSSYMSNVSNAIGALAQHTDSIESFQPLSLGSLSDLQLPSRRQSVVMSDAPPLPSSLSAVNLMGQSTHSQMQHQQQQQLQLQQFQQQQQQQLHQQQQVQQQQLQQQQQQEIQQQQQLQREQQQQQHQQHQNQQHTQQAQHTHQHQQPNSANQQRQQLQRIQRQQNRKEDQQQLRDQQQEKEEQHDIHVQQQRAQQAQQTVQLQRQEEQQHQQTQAQQTQQQKQMSMNLDLDMAIDSGLFGQAMGEHGHQLFQGDAAIHGGPNSTLTEFTKRRNWSQRIIEEIQDFMHILTPNGKIRYASPNSKVLTGYTPEELVGRMITDYIHTDDSHLFIREFNESIASGHKLRFYYRFKAKDEKYVIFEATGHPHFADQRQMPGGNIGELDASITSNNSNAVCGGFFMMARQYPTRNAALLDSFLEHKIENERLTQRIAELKREEAEDQQTQLQARSRTSGSVISSTVDSSRTETNRPQTNPLPDPKDPRKTVPPTSHSMPPPAKPSAHGAALTRQNLDSFDNTIASRQDSLREKMARFEGATHVETIEMLTGLHYRDGERSNGISTGNTSPSLIRGDAGVPMPADKDNRSGGERKKKVKVANEYVCTDCGTLESPEWRKGPTGPKTLCNACGLRWAKKEKKRGSVSVSAGMDMNEDGNGNGNGQGIPVMSSLLIQSGSGDN